MNCKRWYLERRFMTALRLLSIVIATGIVVPLYGLAGFIGELRRGRIHSAVVKLPHGELGFRYKPNLTNGGIAAPGAPSPVQAIPNPRRTIMWDISMVLSSVAFFAIAIAYTCACERLR